MRVWADHYGVRLDDLQVTSRFLGLVRRMTVTASGPPDALRSYWEELDGELKARVSFWDLLGP